MDYKEMTGDMCFEFLRFLDLGSQSAPFNRSFQDI